MVWAVTRVGAISNVEHLLTISEERGDSNKDWDAAYESKLKVLVINLKGSDKLLLLRFKSTGA